MIIKLESDTEENSDGFSEENVCIVNSFNVYNSMYSTTHDDFVKKQFEIKDNRLHEVNLIIKKYFLLKNFYDLFIF